ncbi:hypothetical protein BMAGN_0209 [Bifidobacterium magnum]|uniref:Uncharacterized protein n=1 Tax=Bifidobacterium magnum TaxID=1692 RepID=A0A087BB58_9BIFI|nr:hypothetical protein BMAGN_0209 [Bifidobacterium magnum]
MNLKDPVTPKTLEEALAHIQYLYKLIRRLNREAREYRQGKRYWKQIALEREQADTNSHTPDKASGH